ncbi:MAG: zinc ribbon-containing protein [Desulfuromonadales bacterium]|nr:zinc ribbon-containing protein [Desulfuromonadales bacterium]NIR34222.1 zinc ribbon-containing protein [Desulfuromonadales bacterium]NIS44173.1 zinc ribbon-containing protein [Desulfuromonadales bacterium]
MSIKAGEEVKKTGDFRCRKCGDIVHVEEGLIMPRCPVCNGETFSLKDRPLNPA